MNSTPHIRDPDLSLFAANENLAVTKGHARLHIYLAVAADVVTFEHEQLRVVIKKDHN